MFLTARLVAAEMVFLTLLLLPMTAAAGNKVWKNTGTNFNTNGSWTPSGVPGVSDVAVFDVVEVTNPNLSGSLTIQELNFSTTAASGYDLTSSNTGVKLTLSNTGTGTTSAINAADTSGTNTIDAPLVLGAAAASTQTFTQASGGTLVVNGVISSTNAVTLGIAGGGIVQLGGVNTYSGGTIVNAGTLLVNGGSFASSTSGSGSGTVTVNGSGTLGGTGNITGAVTLVNGGTAATLNSGPKGTDGTAASVGTLHTGSLTLTGANIFHVDFSSTLNYDQLFVTGAVALGATSTLQLSIPTGLNFQGGTNYTLINNDGTLDAIVGTFSNAANGSTVNLGGYNFTVNYAGGDGNDFVLTAVPEPSTWVAAALASLAMGYSMRRRIGKKLKPETLKF